MLRVGEVVFPQEEGVQKMVIQNQTTSPEIIYMQHWTDLGGREIESKWESEAGEQLK